MEILRIIFSSRVLQWIFSHGQYNVETLHIKERDFYGRVRQIILKVPHLPDNKYIEWFSSFTGDKPLRILGPRYANERLLPQMLMHTETLCNIVLWWKLKLVPEMKERSSRMARQGPTKTSSTESQTLMSWPGGYGPQGEVDSAYLLVYNWV